MSYRDRLRGQIELTSPSGIIFTPKWIGNERSKEKKLGVFEYPNNNGTKTQDLGINGTRYPLTLYFDGPDNDLESTKFFNTCDERGPWDILHPTKGQLTLQLVSVSENIQPVDSGSITIFDTQWIEPQEDTVTKSNAQTASEVQASADETNLSSVDQFNENVVQDSFSEISAIKSNIANFSESVGSAFEDINQLSDAISSQFLAIQRGIQDTLDQVILQPIILAGQIQQLTQLPALATQDIKSRLESYGNLAADVLSSLPGATAPEDKNAVSSQELGLSAAVVGSCQSVITGPLTNRSEAINFAESLTTLLADITEGLDTVQDDFNDADIDKQYFSNSQAYNNLKNVVALSVRYLLNNLVSLNIEKRFTLDRPRSPIEITVTEYGSLGENDELLDFFLSTNNLSNKEIRLLQTGKEVVVYA